MIIKPQDETRDSFMTARGNGFFRVKGKDIWTPFLYVSLDMTKEELLSVFEDTTDAPPTIPGYQWSTERVVEAILSAAGIDQAEVTDKHPEEPWRVGEGVLKGFVREYEGELYECLQAHVTQSDWTPPIVPALWKHIPKVIDDTPPPWKQPQGSHDAYKKGDKVTHKNKTWISTYDGANVWEPGVYGWAVA